MLVGLARAMSESPTVDEFIRHMQAELDACQDIPDVQERQQRQWQIEASMQQAIVFSNKFKELQKLGKDPLKLIQALSMPEGPSAEEAKQAIAKVGGFCPSCGYNIPDDLDFCEKCGDYSE